MVFYLILAFIGVLIIENLRGHCLNELPDVMYNDKESKHMPETHVFKWQLPSF